MKRRTFLKTSFAASGVAGLAAAWTLNAAEQSEKPAREFYELRRYLLRKGPKEKLFHDYFRNAALPALKRIGIGPVGVFTVAAGPDSPAAYVLVPHKSLESLTTVSERLAHDKEYQNAGIEFIEATAKDPAYVRIESSLMIAFESVPKIEVPAAAAGNKPRLFELRTYESHSKKANKKKIEMFNMGEVAIFRRAGLQPVFFGETLIGGKLPNLTYLLAFENMAARDKNWGVFSSDPEWRKLSSTPGYTDPEIVSNISNLFLRPAPYSQI